MSFRDWIASVQEGVKNGDPRATALASLSWKPPAPVQPTREHTVARTAALAWAERIEEGTGGSGGALPSMPTAADVQEIIAKEDAAAAYAASLKADAERDASAASRARDDLALAKADLAAMKDRLLRLQDQQARERDLEARAMAARSCPD